MEQCFLEGNLRDKNQEKAVLCHLACIGEKTNHKCIDSFKIEEMMRPTSTDGFVLKPGSPCVGTLGYCDIFSKCRSVDGEGPLLRLKKFLLNPVILSSIRQWITVSIGFNYLSIGIFKLFIIFYQFLRHIGGELCLSPSV